MASFEGFRETLATDAETIAAKFKARAIMLRECRTIEDLVELTTHIDRDATFAYCLISQNSNSEVTICALKNFFS